MSHNRKPILQLDERGTSSPLRSKNAVIDEEEDDDSMGDMPTPERLVEQDLPTFGQPTATSKPRDIDDKVANFLAEIDALQPGDENSSSPPPPKIPVEREEESPPRFMQPSPPPSARGNTPPPPRTKPGAYSNMFVKGTPEFVKKKDEKKSEHESKVQLEPWPEEPKTEWQQLMDENTNYPYYWHTVTNDVVWDMPPEFSKYLILKKEYEEKVEKGLKEGTLDPSKRSVKEPVKAQKSPVPHPKLRESLPEVKQESTSHDKKRRLSHSEDSSSDSSDSDNERNKKPRKESNQEVSSTTMHKDSEKEKSSSKEKKIEPSDLSDTTETKKISPPIDEVEGTEESMDFDIDDIDKELEMALERKRQELMSKEENKKEKDTDKERSKDKDRRRRDDDRKSDRHRDRRRDDDRRKHRHRDRDRDRDREKDRDSKDRDKKHKEIIEPEVPKLTLKDRLKMEMELKLEKERKMKKALIEEMMAKELEKTVASNFARGSMRRGRDDLDRESRKRYRDDGDPRRRGSRDQDDLRRGTYDAWDRHGSFNDDYSAPLKPPPPTAEMLAYEEERRSEVVDYGHGRSRKYDQNGDSDPEDTRPADIRDIEIKKLEALQLAELALSKLEFLEVSKKGLSKLQILLIELETRHLDWQAGGLTTNHFLTKLRETNRQLEQYEASAAPSGWVCSWDRDYRRYFYTHKVTGKTQWDYPDADDIRAEDTKVKEGKGKPKTEMAPGINSTNDQLQGFSVEKDLTQEILASVTLPPPPPPPAEEHPSVKSLQLMYGSSSDSEAEEPATKNKDKSDKEENPPPPLQPLPKEEKHTEKEKKHKSKKKKKEKSKRKEQEQGVVGPVYPDPATVTGAESYSKGMMTYDQSQSGEMAYSDPQALEAWYAAQGQTGSEIPVYGQVAGPEAYTQNDQPLEFGTVPEGGYPTSGEGGDSSYHPPETYKAVPTVYSESNGAGDGVQSTSTESQDGLNIEIGTLIPPNTEEKKKKKKEKMGNSNISLKKKHVSSMVQKWQKVKKEVELEERDREIREAEIRRKLAELD